MSDLQPVSFLGVTTAADVGAAMTQVDQDMRGLDAVILACPGLTDATKAQWTAFLQSWNGFSVATHDQIVHIPMTGAAFGTFVPEAKLAQIDGFRTTLLDWHQIASKSCGAQGPTQKPKGSWWDDNKGFVIGGIVVVGLLALSPVIVETIAAMRTARRLT